MPLPEPRASGYNPLFKISFQGIGNGDQPCTFSCQFAQKELSPIAENDSKLCCFLCGLPTSCIPMPNERREIWLERVKSGKHSSLLMHTVQGYTTSQLKAQGKGIFQKYFLSFNIRKSSIQSYLSYLEGRMSFQYAFQIVYFRQWLVGKCTNPPSAGSLSEDNTSHSSLLLVA